MSLTMQMTAPAPVTSPAIGTPALEARIVDNYDEFLALEPVWTGLVARSGATHPFLEHSWAQSWWDCFGAGCRLHVIVVCEGSEPVAIAPLLISNASISGLPVRCLGFFYNSHVPRAGFIVAKRAAEVYELIWNHARRFTSWDLILLCQLTEDSEEFRRIRQLAERDGFPAGVWKSGASPRVPVGDSWDAYFQTLPAKHRSNLRNRYKRLDGLGQVELDTVTGGTRRNNAMDEGLALEAAAWKRANGTAILSDRSSTRFYQQFSALAAERGWLRLNFLRVNGRAVAFDYSLEYADRIFLLKLGYDPEFSAYSPSNLLLGTVLKQTFLRGLSEYDFLGEEADWKRCWTTDARTNVWLYVFASSWKGQLLHYLKFTVIPAFKTSRTAKRLSALRTALHTSFRSLHGGSSH